MRSNPAERLSIPKKEPGSPLLAAGLGVVVALPFVLLLLLSVGQVWRFPDVLPPAYSFDAFSRIVSADSDLLTGLWLSLSLSASVAVVATGLGFVISRAVAQPYHTSPPAAVQSTSVGQSRRTSVDPTDTTFDNGLHIGPTSGVSFLYKWQEGGVDRPTDQGGEAVPLASYGDVPLPKTSKCPLPGLDEGRNLM